MSERFIVMTAAAKMPSSCWGKYGRVAVVECAPGMVPKQINPNHKAVKRIVQLWDRRRIGKTSRSAFQRALAEAEEYCEELNLADLAQKATA